MAHISKRIRRHIRGCYSLGHLQDGLSSPLHYKHRHAQLLREIDLLLSVFDGVSGNAHLVPTPQEFQSPPALFGTQRAVRRRGLEVLMCV